MKTRKTLFILTSLLLAAVAIAGESTSSEFEVVVDDGTADGKTHLSLNSEDMGFDIQELQVGETRSIVDESGRSILITREADGFNINVDGKTIELPHIGGENGAMWFDSGDSADVDVHVMHGAKFMSSGNSDGVTIISAKPIDEVTRDSIKSLLTSSGHNGDVNFIDGSGVHGEKHVIRIVRQEAETAL